LDFRPNARLEKKITRLLQEMSLAEKVSLLSGRDSWRTAEIPRLGIPSLVMTDGPHGVRACDAFLRPKFGPATWFPSGFSMGASWDPVLVGEAASAMAEETRYYGCDILLGPCINMVRVPLAGRNFETLSEDPFLSGRLGVAYVAALQKAGTGASVKHFACNNQEYERMRGSSEVDERTLREIYLPAFEAVVREARPATVMTSYNRLNGDYASQNRFLMHQVLRREWGFRGMILSDWGGNHTTRESLENGLNLEMPGPAFYYGKLVEAAVKNWQMEESVVDEAARYVLRVVLTLAAGRRGRFTANTKPHQALSRRVAEESIILLKNEREALPLPPSALRTLAVVGPNADRCPEGGGSSNVPSPYRIDPLSALRRRLRGVEVLFERGCENFVEPPVLPGDFLRPPQGRGSGVRAEYFNNATFSGKPVVSRVEPKIDFWSWGNLPLGELTDCYSLRYTGRFRVPQDGTFRLLVRAPGGLKVSLAGKLLGKAALPTTKDLDPWRRIEARLDLKAGRWYDLRIEYVHPPFLNFSQVRLGSGRVSRTAFSDEIARAAELAARADAAVVVAGYPDLFESEEFDRKDMDLPGEQTRLIEAVAAANPRTIVVLNAGAPVAMPWADRVQAIFLTGYAGQEAGEAVASILTGEVNPSGKLPVTFPRTLKDSPAMRYYPGGRKVVYGEGIFMGYRGFDRNGTEPLFCFGHGLSYTTFLYSALSLPKRVRMGQKVRLSMTVRNTGDVAGAEVVQVYVGDPKASVKKPVRELKGFRKVFLKPGESRRLSFTLDQRALSFYDVRRKAWVAEKGLFTVEVGASSRDIRLKGSFRLI
jgi:beta-glucosidase